MKELQLSVPEFKAALAGFNKLVSHGVTLPILGCIRVQPSPEGVSLQVTDLDSFATCRLDAVAPPDFPPCLVSMTTLARVAKSAKGRIHLIREGEQRFKIRHYIGEHPVEQPIESVPIEEWPTPTQFKAKPFLVEPGFKEAFRHAMECASTDCSRLILNGAFLDVSKPDCHCVVGTDGRHLFSANTFHFPIDESAVIPSRKFLNWSGFADDGDWLLAVQPPEEGANPKPPYIQIQSQHWIFLTRGIEGQYPDWRQIMPGQDRKFTRVVLSDQAVKVILDALPRLPRSIESDHSVVIAVEAGNLFLRTQTAVETGVEIPVPGVLVTGPDAQVYLDRNFISQALRFGLTELEVQDALSPVLFTGPGKQMLAAPMRYRTAPEPAGAAQTTQPSSQPGASRVEIAEPVPPSAGQSDNPAEPTNAMATNNITTLPAPERTNPKPSNGSNSEPVTGMKAVVDHVEKIKLNLRDVIADLNDTLDLLKTAEKEKKATLKEVESVRATLRSLQKVEL
jgi:DNA polymerase III sliding clamp (beta) subunit (PCNA family)